MILRFFHMRIVNNCGTGTHARAQIVLCVIYVLLDILD